MRSWWSGACLGLASWSYTWRDVCRYDRAAPRGTGSAKVAGNYAADLRPSAEAKQAPTVHGRSCSVCLYLNAATQSYVEEFSTSNFIAFAHDGR